MCAALSAEAQAPYALGFTSLDVEADHVPLSVEGELPAWLGGSLVRNGPAKFEVGQRSFTHWFDGLAMLHCFNLGGGGVTYSSRFLRSRSYCEAMASGRIARSEFMTDPCRTLFGRVMSMFFPQPTDNGSVNVAMVAGKMAALTETPMPVLFDPKTLETIGYAECPPASAGHMATAHPHDDGEHRYSYATAFGRSSRYRIFAEYGEGQRLLAEIPTDRPAYMHSFGMSERYLILTEFPLRLNSLRLLLSGEPFIRNFRWQPELGTLITVIDKRDGAIVVRARAPASFAFHHVNAFEEEGVLSIDLLTYPDPGVIEQLTLLRLRSGGAAIAAGRLTRLRVALEGSEPGATVAAEQSFIGDVCLELPRIDYVRRAGRRYRLIWGTGQSEGAEFLDNITKIELREGGGADVRRWAYPGCYPGEPVFVSRPGGTREDDGVILSVVLDVRAGRSFLLVLDASSLSEIARAMVPHHIPFGFHGNHFPSSSPAGSKSEAASSI